MWGGWMTTQVKVAGCAREADDGKGADWGWTLVL